MFFYKSHNKTTKGLVKSMQASIVHISDNLIDTVFCRVRTMVGNSDN